MRVNRIHKKSGETLVEILVSGFLFLMMMAVLQGAVSFCSSAQQKSRQLRDSNARLCQNLRAADGIAGEANGEKELSFRAVSPDGSQIGSHVFTVKAALEKKDISDGEGRKTTFFLFAPKETGGGSP